MKKIIFFLFAALPFFVFSQKMKTDNSTSKNSKEILEIKKFQANLNQEYLNKKETPLRGDNFENFKTHPFFPIDLKYRVIAGFVKNENPEPFDLPTSSGKSKSYQEFGKAHFTIEGKSYTLPPPPRPPPPPPPPPTPPPP